MERIRASLEDNKDAGDVKSAEMWHSEMSKLQKHISEQAWEIVNLSRIQRARAKAHTNTLVMLTETMDELKQSKLECNVLKRKLFKQVKCHQNQFSEQEADFKKKLSEKMSKWKKELAYERQKMKQRLWNKEKCHKEMHSAKLTETKQKLSRQCEARAQQWAEEKAELEKKLAVMERRST